MSFHNSFCVVQVSSIKSMFLLWLLRLQQVSNLQPSTPTKRACGMKQQQLLLWLQSLHIPLSTRRGSHPLFMLLLSHNHQIQSRQAPV